MTFHSRMVESESHVWKCFYANTTDAAIQYKSLQDLKRPALVQSYYERRRVAPPTKVSTAGQCWVRAPTRIQTSSRTRLAAAWIGCFPYLSTLSQLLALYRVQRWRMVKPPPKKKSSWSYFFGTRNSSAITGCFQIDSNLGPHEYEEYLTIKPRSWIWRVNVETEVMFTNFISPNRSTDFH